MSTNCLRVLTNVPPNYVQLRLQKGITLLKANNDWLRQIGEVEEVYKGLSMGSFWQFQHRNLGNGRVPSFSQSNRLQSHNINTPEQPAQHCYNVSRRGFQFQDPGSNIGLPL